MDMNLSNAGGAEGQEAWYAEPRVAKGQTLIERLNNNNIKLEFSQ